MKFIFFDTETTGIPNMYDTVTTTCPTTGKTTTDRYRARGEVIQLSAIVCNMDLQIEDIITFYCDPGEPITDGAFNIHNVSNRAIKELSKGKTLEEYVYNDYKEIFTSKGNIFVGHNVPFDIKVVNNTLLSYGYPEIDFGKSVPNLNYLEEGKNYNMCTMRLCKSLFKYHKNPKLEEAIKLVGLTDKMDFLFDNISKRFGVGTASKYHDSTYDAFASYAVMCMIKDRL